jgi:hypothetical protein
MKVRHVHMIHYKAPTPINGSTVCGLSLTDPAVRRTMEPPRVTCRTCSQVGEKFYGPMKGAAPSSAKRRRKAGPCLMGRRADRWDARTQRMVPRVKWPRGCARMLTRTKSGICSSCRQKRGTKRRPKKEEA